MRDRSKVRTGLAAVGAALGVLAGTPGPVLAAPADGSEGVASYRPRGTEIAGTSGKDGAPRLAPKGTYVDGIGPGQRRHYRVELDADSTAYLSAVAVPPPGSDPAARADGIKVSLLDGDGAVCDRTDVRAQVRGVAFPLAGYASRRKETGPRATCQEAGAYDFVVERTGVSGGASDEGTGEAAEGLSGGDRWPLELSFQREPAVRGEESARPAAQGLPTRPSEMPQGPARELRPGGTGFSDARALSTGVWKLRMKPGETRFYRVPLDWGQQFYADVELPDATRGVDKDRGTGAPTGPGTGGGTGTGTGSRTGSGAYVGDALGVSLYNPARGLVQRGAFAPYKGARAEDRLGLTAPVTYGNRYESAKARVRAMSVAGPYYLAVTLNAGTAPYFEGSAPVTLRVAVEGERRPAPGYREDPDGAGLGAPRGDGPAAASGTDDGPDGTLRAVAYASFGTGTLLLLGLGLWTVLGVRRLSRTP
ncbi:hypothetical protein [Streptomyces sp. XD-27]|uniref:hypothetical protein n=1 Tax=Streptomyces sp. XD-27 TaxID=3062779 RepID=UPI0026F47688|nr:hypothetical protein [Streptomyces sp. XD-27]WKX71487.1 hypothetical protein Q3Y56_17630 [Streptomyces sp. XD-27]